MTGLRHILVRHEAGAAHAAEGYARSTGKPGVVLVTSGPGATNAVTGIADAYLDSIPLVVITGQVPTGLIGTDAFQEADTVGITRHCTKHNYLVKDAAQLERHAVRSLPHRHHRSPRPGAGRYPQGCADRGRGGRGGGRTAARLAPLPPHPARRGSPTSRALSKCWPRPNVRCSTPAAASSIPVPKPAPCCGGCRA